MKLHVVSDDNKIVSETHAATWGPLYALNCIGMYLIELYQIRSDTIPFNNSSRKTVDAFSVLFSNNGNFSYIAKTGDVGQLDFGKRRREENNTEALFLPSKWNVETTYFFFEIVINKFQLLKSETIDNRWFGKSKEKSRWGAISWFYII